MKAFKIFAIAGIYVLTTWYIVAISVRYERLKNAYTTVYMLDILGKNLQSGDLAQVGPYKLFSRVSGDYILAQRNNSFDGRLLSNWMEKK